MTDEGALVGDIHHTEFLNVGRQAHALCMPGVRLCACRRLHCHLQPVGVQLLRRVRKVCHGALPRLLKFGKAP
jgi:hypothetical protein